MKELHQHRVRALFACRFTRQDRAISPLDEKSDPAGVALIWPSKLIINVTIKRDLRNLVVKRAAEQNLGRVRVEPQKEAAG
jgi:hypothetical protein